MQSEIEWAANETDHKDSTLFISSSNRSVAVIAEKAIDINNKPLHFLIHTVF